ncbi:MAG: efflux RND transporter periplasmic adaptor subunit [Gemmatimonadaceae bacterium]|nr:efflux RND transporter periplasmic adaptor subunit [Gemmatimonadaceae bacterium]
MRTLRRFLPLVVLLAIAGALYTGYGRLAARPPLVEVTTARTENAVRVLALTGRVRPRLANRVQSLVAGTILSLTHEEGDAVRRGDVLARLDAQTTRAAIRQASSQVNARRLDVQQRELEYKRLETLLASGGVAPRDVETAKFALETARETVRQLEALVSESESRLRDFTLVSPIDGYVLARPVDPGQNVTPQTVLYELATATGAEIAVEIDEQYLGELRVGLDATVSPLTGERQQLAARVSTIGRRVSESSGAVPVRLAFVGVAPRLPAGLSVDVNLVVATHPAATTVSRAAVAGLGGEPYVMLVRRDTIVRQPVQVIDWPSPHIVVTGGIKPGDTMALSPKLVRAGLVVRTKPGPDAL